MWSTDATMNGQMIEQCQKCAGSLGYYGEKQFYCNGECMSEYSSRQVCSTTSLVAMDPTQCESPCYQTKPPDLGAGKGMVKGVDGGYYSKERYTNLHPLAVYVSPPNGSQWIGIL